MAQEVKLSAFVDLPKMQAEFDQLIAEANKYMAIVKTINENPIGGKAANMSDVKKNYDEIQRSTEQLEKAKTKLTAAESEVGKAIIAETQALKEQKRANDLSVQATNEKIGAYKRVEAEMQIAKNSAKDLAMQLYEMEKAGKSNTMAYTYLEQKLKEATTVSQNLDAQFKAVDAMIGNHQRNVGNYEGAVASLRAQIRNLTHTLAQMELQGKANTKEYQTMVMHLGKLRDAVGDVQARSKFFADDQRYITGTVSALQGLIGAYSAYVAAVGLVAGEDEELAKNMQELMQIMVLMNGVQQVATALNKDNAASVMIKLAAEKLGIITVAESTTKTAAQTTATIADTAATNANTVAKTASRGIIGLVIAAVAALAIGIYKLISAQDKRAAGVIKDTMLSKEQIELYNELIDIHNKSIESINQEVARAEIRFGVLLKTKRGTDEYRAAIDEINKSYGPYIKNLDAEKSSLDDIAIAYKAVIEGIKAKIVAQSTEEELMAAIKVNTQIQQKINLNKRYADQILDFNKKQLEFEAQARAGMLQPGAIAPEVPQGLKSLEIAYGNLSNALVKINDDILPDLDDQLADNNKLISTLQFNATSAAQRLNYLTAGMTEVAGSTSRINIEIKRAGFELSKVNETFKATQVLIDDLADEAVLVGKMDEYKGVFDELRKSGEELRRELEKEEAVFRRLVESGNDITDLSIQFATFQENIKKLSQGVGDWGSKVEQIAGRIIEIYDQKNEESTKSFRKSTDERLAGLEKLYNEGIYTQEEYSERRKFLEEEYAAFKAENDKKIFDRNKKFQLAMAAVNMAGAILVALSTAGNIYAGIAEAAAAGLTGLLQIALISGTSFSGYAKGRRGGKDEFAWVGEEGYEYIETGGKLIKTPNTRTLTHLPKDANVYTHAESVKIDKYISSSTGSAGVYDGQILDTLNKIAAKPTLNINVNERGLGVMLANHGSYLRYVNNNINFSI